MTGIQNVNNLILIYHIFTLFILLLFAAYDYRHHKVRNTALLAFLPWCLLSLPVNCIHSPWLPEIWVCINAISGLLSGGLLLLIISMLTKGGIGGGDIKLTALIGLIFGATGILSILFAASLTALVHLQAMALIHGERERPTHIPFVPYLFIGSLFIALLSY